MGNKELLFIWGRVSTILRNRVLFGPNWKMKYCNILEIANRHYNILEIGNRRSKGSAIGTHGD